MILDINQTNAILLKLQDYGFKVVCRGNSLKNLIEEISEDYFNEKVNEALEEEN